MNILPKKRWHVRTKDNIARVRRDEAEAAEQERQRVQRAKLAEQESRTAYLRTKARAEHGEEYRREDPKPQRGGNSQPASKKTEADIYTAAGNINFFKEVELGKVSGGTNKECEEEKKAEQENYEKKIGYLTYLGQNSHEAKGDRPWYEIRDCSTQAETEEVGLKSKAKLDPINDIIKYTGLKPVKKTTFVKKIKDEESQEKIKIVEESQEKIKIVEEKQCQNHYRKKLKQKRRHKKHKKEHKKKKQKKHELKNKMTVTERSKSKNMDREMCSTRKRKRYNSSDSEEICDPKKRKRTRSSDSSCSADDSEDSDMSSSESSDDRRKEKQAKIEALRAERLKREAEERRRAEKLLAGQKSEGVEIPAISKSIFQQQYHSQFNPQIARQNQEPKTLEVGVKYWLQ